MFPQFKGSCKKTRMFPQFKGSCKKMNPRCEIVISPCGLSPSALFRLILGWFTLDQSQHIGSHLFTLALMINIQNPPFGNRQKNISLHTEHIKKDTKGYKSMVFYQISLAFNAVFWFGQSVISWKNSTSMCFCSVKWTICYQSKCVTYLYWIIFLSILMKCLLKQCARMLYNAVCYIWLIFSLMCYQMTPQIAFPRISKVTFIALFYFSPLCVFKCLLKFSAREEAKSHWLHLFGFSPLCVFKWVLKWLACENATLHWLHLFGFSPLCVFKWVLKLLALEDA